MLWALKRSPMRSSRASKKASYETKVPAVVSSGAQKVGKRWGLLTDDIEYDMLVLRGHGDKSIVRSNCKVKLVKGDHKLAQICRRFGELFEDFNQYPQRIASCIAQARRLVNDSIMVSLVSIHGCLEPHRLPLTQPWCSQVESGISVSCAVCNGVSRCHAILHK